MRLNVSVPVSELDGGWRRLVREIILASLFVILGLSLVAGWFSIGITRPLEKLTTAAEQVDRGIYDFDLDYEGDDEIGRLTSTFRQLAGHVKEHITDLNRKVYVDALTSVRNKGAFSAFLDKLQSDLDDSDVKPEFRVCVFDCDDLKTINDVYGHDKGDIYLKTASRLICHVFQHSPVFRIGGDEFSAILQNEDYENRAELAERFEKERAGINAAAANPWEQVHITMGCSDYDPNNDRAVIDTVRRADKDMYDRKRAKKVNR
jgi:diguanylate cyclase (GGDEF)-like protein